MHEQQINHVKCCWCGWHGLEIELDLNEYDEPCYCPVCEHSEYIMDNAEEEE